MKGGWYLPEPVAGFSRNHWPSTFRIEWLVWPEYASGEIQKQFGNQTLPIITSIEPPLVEELMFRGIILTLLLRTYSRWFSIIWSSLLFAFIHIELGGEYMIMAFLGALIVFSVLRIQSKSIWCGAFAHFAMIKGLAGATLVSFVVLELVLLFSRLIRVVRGIT